MASVSPSGEARATAGRESGRPARPCPAEEPDVTFPGVNPSDPAPRTEPDAAPGPSDDADDGSPDATLGGYFRTHDRPPAFQGVDGHPYTVSIEVEKTADLRAPWDGYLVFPRWARTGLGIEGHLETPTLWREASREAVLNRAGEAPLVQVQSWLDQAITAASDTDA